MTTDSLPPPHLLRQLLRYEPETGKLFWRERPRAMFQSDRIANSWNTKWAGTEAFTTVNSRGYKIGSVSRKTMQAHRVIWAIVHGCWPSGEIDHIDHDKANNRIDNLREASRHENCRNISSAAGGTSRYLGVYRRDDSEVPKWRAEIAPLRKRIGLGTFSNEEDAARAYDAAARLHYGEFASLNFP